MGIEEFIIQEVTKLVMPILEERGMELVDIHYRREGGGWVLRVFIDKEGGVNVEDCAEVSRELGYHLDVREVIPNNYNLEISSPGVNRPLKKIDDFKRFSGHTVRITTSEFIDNRRNFTGVIKGVEGDKIIIEVDKNMYTIPHSIINKANLKEI
jgi:ribosome maturation factor RimP